MIALLTVVARLHFVKQLLSNVLLKVFLVLFFCKPKIKRHAALPLVPDVVQSGWLTPPKLALSPLLLIMVQMSRFCAVI